MNTLPDFTLPVHDPVLIFALVMLIVLLAPLLFARLRVPGLIGLILCGAVVGPSGLGVLERDSTMVLLGTVGLLYLMFVAGLGLDLNQFNKLRNRSLTFGLFSFLIPQSMGILAGLYLLGYDLPASVLLGSIVGSHTLLAYPIANRLNITKNTAVTMTMGGTIVTDMLALLLLAVVTGTADGAPSLGFWVTFIGLILLYLVLVLKGLPRLGQWFLRSIRNDPNLAFTFLVTILFVTAYLASLAGLAPIIGAFLAGIVLNRLVPESSPLMSRVQFVGETLFIPFFLLSVGMLVDFRVLIGSLSVWLVAGIFILIVLLGKGLAAQITRLIFRHSAAEGWTIFGLSVPQAAATLAVTLVGFDQGFFDETAVNAVVVMILITCMVGPSMVEKYGRQVALAEEQRPYEPSEAPQRILIPLSNPATTNALVELALAIRRPNSDEPVFPLAVVRDDGDVAEQVAAGEQLLSHAVVHTVAADAPVTPVTRVDMNVANGIARAVAEQRISHVVIGWGGQPSPKQRIFGSILDRLLDVTAMQLLVCKLSHPINTMQRVVLAVPPLAEREPGFDEALRTIKLLANRIGADLMVVVVKRHQAAVEQALQATQPEVPLTLKPLDTYSHLPSSLTGTLTPEDLVVLLSARDTQISWQPSLDRLPRLLAQRFSDTDFIVVYPSTLELQPTATPKSPEAARSAGEALPPIYTTLDLEAAPAAVALPSIMEAAFEERPQVLERIVARLLRESDAMRQEIAPGVLLLHAHTSLVNRQLLFLGASPEGITFPSLPHPAHILFILLNPSRLSPEEHLRTLANLAHSIHDAQQPDRTVDLDALLHALGLEPDHVPRNLGGG